MRQLAPAGRVAYAAHEVIVDGFDREKYAEYMVIPEEIREAMTGIAVSNEEALNEVSDRFGIRPSQLRSIAEAPSTDQVAESGDQPLHCSRSMGVPDLRRLVEATSPSGRARTST